MTMNSTSSHFGPAITFEDCAASVHPPAGTIAPTYRPDRHVFVGRDAPCCVGVSHLGGEVDTRRDIHYSNRRRETLRASRPTDANRWGQDPCEDQDIGLTNLGGTCSVAPESYRSQCAPPKRFARAGFTLVEVTLAVAITVIGLIAVMGLLGGGTSASRRVTDDSVMTTLVDDMIAWRKITPFDRPSYFPYSNLLVQATPRPYTYTEFFNVNGYLQYDVAGQQLTNWSRYFKFTYTVMDHPAFPGSRDIARLHIMVEWPVHPITGDALPTTQRRAFVTQIARLR